MEEKLNLTFEWVQPINTWCDNDQDRSKRIVKLRADRHLKEYRLDSTDSRLEWSYEFIDHRGEADDRLGINYEGSVVLHCRVPKEVIPQETLARLDRIEAVAT